MGRESTTRPSSESVVSSTLRSAEPTGWIRYAVLAECGGLEIAALAGLIVGGATARCPVVIDGLIALAGAVVAERLCPGVVRWCIAGHRSTEPGATVALECLGLEPLIDLGLRLGEGTGAALALPMLESAARLLAEMATFADLGLSPEA